MNDDPSGRPIDFGQALFGSQDAFTQYWSQYSNVVGNNAMGVTANPDGSDNVPVDVTYTKNGQQGVTQHKNIKVIRYNGQILIDGDPRQS